MKHASLPLVNVIAILLNKTLRHLAGSQLVKQHGYGSVSSQSIRTSNVTVN